MSGYLNRGLSKQTLLICELWNAGMSHAEIAAKIDKSVALVGQALFRSRRAGVKLRPRVSEATRPSSLSEHYQVQIGNVGSALKNLPRPALHWLFKNTPAGMTVAEYMAAFVLDAYHEEENSND
jgi:hypothetical protein